MVSRRCSPKTSISATGDERSKEQYISMNQLVEQIRINKEHLKRVKLSSSITSSESATEVEAEGVNLPAVSEYNVNRDTFMLLCLPIPVVTLAAIRRRFRTWLYNLLWSRPPLPCVTTTCGPVFHEQTCRFHPLSSSCNQPYLEAKPIFLGFGSADPKFSLFRNNSLSSASSSSSSSSLANSPS